jgi:anti-anti-sigma factor
MNVIERIENGITVLVLSGRIDALGAADLDLALQDATSRGRRKLVLDMAGVSHLGSLGLRSLLCALARNRETGGELRLAALDPHVMRVLRIIGFDRLLPIHDTIEAAITSFRDAAVGCGENAEDNNGRHLAQSMA